MTKKQKECIMKVKEELKLVKETEDVLVKVDIKDAKIGDEIYVEDDITGVEYTILDMGNPFILIEDETTRFAYLHRVNNIYKKIKKLKND